MADGIFREDLPVPTDEEQATFLTQVQTLDPNQEGIDASRMRAFYPKGSVHRILQQLYMLEHTGKVKRRSVVQGNGRIEKWFWL